MKIADLDCEKVEMNFREDFPNITWISIYMKGTKLHIDIKENIVKNNTQKNKITDIISPYNGIVTSIFVKQGTALVKAGDSLSAIANSLSGLSRQLFLGPRLKAS